MLVNTLIELVSKPYTEIQPGEDGNDKKVWMFPVRLVPDNDVKKHICLFLRIWMTIRHVVKTLMQNMQR